MKKIWKSIILFCAILSVSILIVYGVTQKEMKILFDEETGQISIQLFYEDDIIKGWEKEGVTHYFIPSYVSTSNIRMKDTDLKIFFNGSQTHKLLFNEVCEIQILNKDNDVIFQQDVCFHHSQNLYTLYINLNEDEKEDITKDDYLSAGICMYTSSGKIDYKGTNDFIKGRGNSTWRVDKKPYSLKLQEKNSLCNMNPSRKWSLLANISEGTKLACKMMYDLSGKIGMEYHINSEWVDLYINGEYLGNYLLCEKIEVADDKLNIMDLEKQNEPFLQHSFERYEEDDFKGYIAESNPQDISGGYIIEKDIEGYYESEPCGFKTDRNDCFTVNFPQNATVEEVQYIRNFVQKIDRLIEKGDDSYLQYIDKDSFVRRFLIEELAFNSDAFITSCYFYKKADEDKLYAGPVWDYDGTFGETNGAYLVYDESVLNQNVIRDSDTVLDWDQKLYEDKEYRDYLIKTYKKILPVLYQFLNEEIDNNAEKIRASVTLDSIRWNYGEWKAGHYESYDNNIRYMKFFLRQRINMLNKKWGISDSLQEDNQNCSHVIRCVYEDQIYEFPVKDGEFFKEEDLPAYDNEKYSGWCYLRDGLFFCEYLPVYEDVILIPNKRG